ncbi:hypothetical protein [Leifsonia sp. Leaf264]|uniref:hypothetical protein n=1 Tax=Leifsonia sp. Leaf264 TaxID=1736314 RepID=UPI0006F32670|nr:hypothetical protein [Leifsonia sp. Leaf264]KQO98803.1 hypothetical protein ASF30_12130 [Leifsonia sp. Leaf264]
MNTLTSGLGSAEPNLILAEFREYVTESENPVSAAVEWLYQLGRHWDELAEPGAGTYFIPGFEDLDDPDEQDSTEDGVYWLIANALTYSDDFTAADSVTHAALVLHRYVRVFHTEG